MRRAVFALTGVTVIVFLMAPLAQMVSVKANPISFWNPTIYIESPNAYPSDIYQATSIPIEVIADPYGTVTKFVNMYYSLDGGPNIGLNIIRYENSTFVNTAYYGRGTLDNLTDGYHTLQAYSTDIQGQILSDSITFLVNTTYKFPTLLLSPNNTTYSGKDIPFIYTVDDPKCTVFYRIDNGVYKRLNGNTTLSGLSEGQHIISASAYAPNLTIGIYSKQTANFIMNTTNPTPTPTSTVPEFSSWALPLLFSIMAATAGLLVYRKKRRAKSE